MEALFAHLSLMSLSGACPADTFCLSCKARVVMCGLRDGDLLEEEVQGSNQRCPCHVASGICR